MSELFVKYFDKLIVARDFSPFQDIADGNLDPEEHPGRAQDLEALLTQTVAVLGASIDDRKDAARAINAYVTRVVPLRIKAGLGLGKTPELAHSSGLRGSLSSTALKALKEFEDESGAGDIGTVQAPADIPIEPADGDPAVTTEAAPSEEPRPGSDDAGAAEEADFVKLSQPATNPSESESEVTSQSDISATSAAVPTPSAAEPAVPLGSASRSSAAGMGNAIPRSRRRKAEAFEEESVKFDKVCEMLVKGKKEGRVTAIVAGLATSGKTFFVRRLYHNLKGHYTIHGIYGPMQEFGSTTDRTKGIVYYGLESTKRGWPNIDLFDVPGERFREFAGRQIAAPEDEIKGMSAVFAAADICIIVEPALEVLAPDIYAQRGDSYNQRMLQDFRDEVLLEDEFKSAVPSAVEAEAWSRLSDFLEKHIELVSNFHNNLDAVRKRIVRLRKNAAQAFKARQPKALMESVEAFLKTPYSDLREKHRPLPIPGLLLLSKTDDYASGAVQTDDAYDADPAHSLTNISIEKMRVYSRAFSVFGVDFITSEPALETDEADDPDYDVREFVGREGAAGFDSIIHDWIIPAIRTARRGRGPAKLLSSPRLTHWLRSRLDPDFRSAWARGGQQ